MSFAIGIWSMVLPAQSEGVMYKPPADLIITGASLGGDELVGSNRCLLKLTHIADEEEDDEELDSDMEVEAEDEDSSADVSAEKAGSDEDDEEDSDVDSEASDSDTELQQVTLAALTPGRIEQVVLNVTINEGDAVMFHNMGENEIHLIGNYLASPQDDHDDYDEEFDSDEDGSDVEGLLNDEDVSDDENRIEEIVEEIDLASKLGAHIGKATKRKAIEESIEEDIKSAAVDLAEPESTLSKKAAKKAAKKQKLENGAAAVTETTSVKSENGNKAKASSEQSKKKVHENGLIVEDIKVGDGASAKAGNKIQMRYIGKLTTGKIFDQNTKDKAFKFVLGRGEVIKGWDQGIAGMKVGGERRLTVPASLAYGKRAQAGIPANSTLIFEVKMIGCN